MLRPLVAMALVTGCASSVSATDAGADAADVCGPAQAALAQTLLAERGEVNCAVVVRLSRATLRPIAYQPFCGRPATLTDAQARRSRTRRWFRTRTTSRRSIPDARRRLRLLAVAG
ncbi:MAG: hypothetical protein R3A52_10645 [Polyangiales bacterium]